MDRIILVRWSYGGELWRADQIRRLAWWEDQDGATVRLADGAGYTISKGNMFKLYDWFVHPERPRVLLLDEINPPPVPSIQWGVGIET